MNDNWMVLQTFFGPTGTIEDLYDYEYDNYDNNQ